MLFGNGPKGNKLANAGIGENNIEMPLHLRDTLIKTIEVSQFGNISLNCGNVGADCLHGRVEVLLAAACDEDIGTFFDEQLRRSQPNPFRPPGDNGSLAFEFLGHCFSLAPFKKKSIVTGSAPLFRHAWRVRFAPPRRRASDAESRRRPTPAKSLRRRQPSSPQCSFCASQDLPFRSGRLIPLDEPMLRLLRPRHRKTDPRKLSWVEMSRSAGSCRQVPERRSRDSCQPSAAC